jgi:Holliday junction resolvasome RuvABC endonuclease subunit
MIVLCLDPSLRNTGVSVLETSGPFNMPKKILHHETIKTKASKDERVSKEYSEISRLIKLLLIVKKEYDPALVVSELPYGAQGYKGAVGVGVSWAISAMLDAYPVSPQSLGDVIKKSKGSDKKQKAINFVAKNLVRDAMFWDVDEMNHVADSICAYYAYLSDTVMAHHLFKY